MFNDLRVLKCIFISVTESEIQEGIMKASEVDSHCLVYKRELRHLHDIGLNDNVAQRYIDITKSETVCGSAFSIMKLYKYMS